MRLVFDRYNPPNRLHEIEQTTRARATVIREERARSIDPSEIVLGDVLVAGPGDPQAANSSRAAVIRNGTVKHLLIFISVLL